MLLYPRESETREVKDLSGLWEFVPDFAGVGRAERWFEKALVGTRSMPVPASYNDLTTEPRLRDHVGDVWYERRTFVPKAWHAERVWLRFGSATHRATVWVNGVEVMAHDGGFLPFSADVTSALQFGAENRITVVVNSALSWRDLPSGETKHVKDDWHPNGFSFQEIHFDFFNYGGLHRPVWLATTPSSYVEDVRVRTELDGNIGRIEYEVRIAGAANPVSVVLNDATGNMVAQADGASGTLVLENVVPWRPGAAYLYSLACEVRSPDGALIDVYRQPVGVRTVSVSGTRFLLNGEPFHFKGFGKHEDSVFRGRGLDHAINVKDFELLRWIGANSFRTSHYPYSEELMELADREGFAVIDEVPAVGMNLWSTKELVFGGERVDEHTLAAHLRAVSELIARDKNRPSVVMWSLCNEAATNEPGAEPYFRSVVAHARSLDQTRPFTYAHGSPDGTCRIAPLFDVICLNRYPSWYRDAGHLELVEGQLGGELKKWFDAYGKPLILSEFGADAVAGLHALPASMFSEEYQVELFQHVHAVIDRAHYVVGEHVWAFADFMTKQGITRVIGNRKGVFTRAREPKAGAHCLRARWRSKHP